MIDLNDFNDLVPKTGRGAADHTRITITPTMCKFILSRSDYDKLHKYFGSTVNVKYSSDMQTFVFTRGADKRVGSQNRDLHIKTLGPKLMEQFGEAVWNIYYDCSMDNDEKGTAVFVLRHNGRKEFHSDATIRRLK